MVTEFDLHERTGVPIEQIRLWLRQHGSGGRPGQRIPLEMEQRFIEAHGGRRSVGEPPQRITRNVARVAEPAGPDPTRQALDEATQQLRTLAARQAGLEAQNAALKADAETARQAAHAAQEAARQTEAARLNAQEALRQAREEARTPRPAAAEVVHPTLRDALERRGLGGRVAAEAFKSLVASEGAAERLLNALWVADVAVLDALKPVCAAVTCREVAVARGYITVPASGTACGVCRGSDNRRWFRLMAARLEQAGRKRLLVVGGADDSLAELDRLAREEPRLKVEAAGDGRMDGTRARALVKSADVVAFWVSTDVSHAESTPFKDAARQDAGVIVAATAPGGRGIASLARAVLEALDAQNPKRRVVEVG